MEKYYLTTTLPYVNANPHIGFATEIVRADAIVRYQKAIGKDVFFNTGTDEHGQKIYDNAREAGINPQEYVDGYAKEFQKLIPELGILAGIHFIRTTDEHHKKAAQTMWQRCMNNVDEKGRPDIYKDRHTIKYCKGCELEKTDSELVDGTCPVHPTYTIELRDEENYFFRFSRYQEPLLNLYAEHRDFVLPDFRMNEIKKFVEGGLQDFSVSRLKSKMPWGIRVPNDDEHIMYVWFDALTNYISTTGWPEKEDFGGWWPGVQVAGKDNLRQQSAIWQAMLLSAKLPTSKQIIVGGFITSGGQKMSKSLGNVISPFELVTRYGIEATRYLLLRHVHPFEDTDITWERLDEWYNAHLANGLGNLVSRIMKMAEDHLSLPIIAQNEPLEKTFIEKVDAYRLDEAMNLVFEHVGKGDLYIQGTLPFKKIKSENESEREEARVVIRKLVQHIYRIAQHLEIFMPETAEKIKRAVQTNKKPETLFGRIEA